MLPDGVLSTTPHPAPFQQPRRRPRAALVDYEQGGIALNDTSRGLLFQTWTARVVDDTVVVSAPLVSPIVALTQAGITEIALSFDLNMRLFLAWVQADGAAKFRWFDVLAGEFVTTTLPDGTRFPRATIDDKRQAETGLADTVLTYLRSGVLYYRQLRDRFQTEYELRTDLDGYRLGQFGMNNLWRLQWELLYPGEVPTPPPEPASTILEVLDTPMFDGGQDDAAGLGLFLAAGSTEADWPGCEVEMSRDAGSSWSLVATITAPSVVGETVTELADHPAAWPDLVNVVRIMLANASRTLTATDLAGICNGANGAMIGSEHVRFAGAAAVGESGYDLSTLLRGRNGTDTEAHAIGARFLLLERSRLVFLPLLEADLGQELRFRARTLGAASVSDNVTLAEFTGATQRERAPMITEARRDGDDVVVQWIGVGRIDFGAFAQHGQAFDDYEVTITDGVLPAIVIDTGDLEVVADAYGLGTPLTIQVRQRNTLTGLGPPAEVVIP